MTTMPTFPLPEVLWKAVDDEFGGCPRLDHTMCHQDDVTQDEQSQEDVEGQGRLVSVKGGTLTSYTLSNNIFHGVYYYILLKL